MRLIKISPKYQITIPRSLRTYCRSGWFALTEEDDNILTLRPVNIQPAKTEQEILDELLKASKWRDGGDLNPRPPQ